MLSGDTRARAALFAALHGARPVLHGTRDVQGSLQEVHFIRLLQEATFLRNLLKRLETELIAAARPIAQLSDEEEQTTAP
jgi:hypothetical protein